jgi:stage II sporulation protein AA (anti-sigma F factor antagonist)
MLGGIIMLLKFEKSGRNLIIIMAGELDHHSAENVRIKIDNNIETMGFPNLIFDFSELNFMDSSGIGVIIGRYKKVSEYDGKVGIINMRSNIRKVFELGGIFNLIKEYKNYDEAVQNF